MGVTGLCCKSSIQNNYDKFTLLKYKRKIHIGWKRVRKRGRLITEQEWYQTWKYDLLYGLMESKFGPPSESNKYIWQDFYDNYW